MKLICLFPLLCFHLALAEFKIPPLRSHVNDYAGILSRSTEDQLNEILSTVKQKTGIELAILTVESLGGLEIEQASIQVTDQWKLGTVKEDKGVLLMAAIQDRKLRIEVGQGLEGTLTDLRSRRIIDYSIVPLMKSGDYNAAFWVGSFKILEDADPNFDFKPYFDSTEMGREIRRPPRHSSSTVFLWIVLFIVIVLILPRLPPGFGGGGYHGGRWGGGGFGGRGGFGGGMGGGGGFSGGGASGGW